MARLADIIVPEVFYPYSVEQTAEKSRLIGSPLVVQTDELNQLAGGGGNAVNMPFFTDLTGDDLGWDEAAETPGRIGTGQDVAWIHLRKKAFESSQLAAYKSGEDPMEAIAGLVGQYWARRQQAALISSLQGVFAAATMAGSLNDQTGNAIDRTVAINTLGLMGDEIDSLGYIFMHSKIFWQLQAQEQIQFIVPSEIDTTLGGEDGMLPTYIGKRVIVDDGMPQITANNYLTVFAGAGAIGYGEGEMDPDDAIMTDKDILSGLDYLATRRIFIMHPLGVAWTGTPAGATATNIELATGANWTRRYEQKNVRLAATITLAV